MPPGDVPVGPADQVNRATHFSGALRMYQLSKAHGQLGTQAVSGSRSIAATNARQPVMVSTIKGVLAALRLSSVSMKPGKIVVTLMGVPDNSALMPSVNAAKPALDAA